jgi:hypothetical protein
MPVFAGDRRQRRAGARWRAAPPCRSRLACSALPWLAARRAGRCTEVAHGPSLLAGWRTEFAYGPALLAGALLAVAAGQPLRDAYARAAGPA